MRDGDAVLIAAQSGRALAQAARRAGLRPFVLDLFGDEDTVQVAEAHRPLPGRFGAGRRAGEAVLAGLAELEALAGGRARGVVLGSGFEGAPELIARIAARHRLIGAGPDSVAALKNPATLAALCARLGIPHPEIRLPQDRSFQTLPHPEAPASASLASQDGGARGNSGLGERSDDWLLKRAGGSGGSHIRPCRAGIVPPGHYAQVRAPGRAHALNILADGRDLAVLAVTEQWSAPSALRPFRFAGVIAPGRDEPSLLSENLRRSMTEAIARLVRATGLTGLASADILVDGSDWWLLEINPRPGASLDALDRRATPLLASHIEACLGSLPALDPAPSYAAGTEICYAAQHYACMGSVDWPDHAHDRPRVGTRVARDGPLCTVSAQGPDRRAVKETLRDRARAIGALTAFREEYHGNRFQGPERQRPGDAAGGGARR